MLLFSSKSSDVILFNFLAKKKNTIFYFVEAENKSDKTCIFIVMIK
jgi:hypothetical protein